MTNRFAEPSHRPPSPIFGGYAKGRFFDRRLMEFSLLVVLVLAGALYLFPRHKVLVQFYLDRGLYNEAIAVISDMMRQRPDDDELMLLRADALERADDPDSAMDQLKQVLAKDPQNRQALTQLARFHEWHRNLPEAIKTFESLAAADPGNLAVLERLWQYYAYLGLVDKEIETVVRLVHQEKIRPLETVLPRLDDATLLAGLMRDPLVRVAARQLQALVSDRRLAGADPVRDELMRRLYSLKANYLWRWSRASDLGIPSVSAALVAFLESFVATGYLDLAAQFAAQVDEIWPQRPRAELVLAQVLRRFQLPRQAMALLADVGRRYGGQRDIQLQLVDIARSAGDLEAAAETLEHLIADQPDNADYRLSLVDVLLEMNRPSRAFQILHEMARSGPTDTVQLARLVQVAGFTGKPGPTAEAADQVRRLVPPDPDLLRQAAEVMTAAGNLDGAAGLLVDYLRLRPADGQAVTQLAQLYLWTNRPDRAYETLRSLAESGDRRHLMAMLEAAQASAKADLAREAALMARRLAPGDADVLLAVGRMLMAVGDTPGAVTAYEAYLSLRPTDTKARQTLATLYQWSGQPLAHARLLVKAAQADPTNAVAARSAGQALVDAGRIQEGIGYLEKAAALTPRDDELRRQIAVYYGWINMPGKSAAILAQAADQDPRNFDKALAAVNALVEADRLAEGIAYLERAAVLRPDEAGLWQRLAVYYGWTGASDKQVNALEKLAAMGRLPDDQAIVLARALLDRNRPAEAAAVLAPLAEAKRLSPDQVMVLASAYLRAGQNSRAEKLFKDLGRDHAGDAALMAEAGNQALWAKRLDLALAFYEKALARDPRNRIALKGSAQVYAWNNDAQKAMARFEAYNRLVPDDHEVRYQLGELYFANGRTGDAMAQYDKAMAIIGRAGKAVGR